MATENEKEIPVITQEEVDRYVALDSQEKSAESAKEKLRLELIRKFEAGAVCPRMGPHVLTLSKVPMKYPDWKGALFALARKHLGELRATKLLALVERRTKPVVAKKILIQRNNDYLKAA